MTKTLAQFKKDCDSKKIVLTMIRRYGESTIPERLQGDRRVVKTQSNGVYLTAKNAPKGSWLEYPKAAQFEYTEDMVIIYAVGCREFNQKELAALEEWKRITETKEYQNALEYDMLTDYNGCYYKEKAFWERKGMEYMFHESKGGLKRDWNEDKVWDNSIKGEELFAYKVRFEN